MADKIDALIKQVNKKFGENAIMRLEDMPVHPPISSGSIALDMATGFGGLPQDRMIEIVGKEGTGKTSLGLLSMSSFLDAQPDRAALILDTEHKLTYDWVKKLIGDERAKRVLLAWPDYAEQVIDYYMDVVPTGDISFVLFDSIAATPTKRASEESAEKKEYGGAAKELSNFARLAAGASQKYRTLTCCLNQVRIDMTGRHGLNTPGGTALKHAYILRIHLRPGDKKVAEKIDSEEIQVGRTINAKIVKNQIGPPGRVAEYWFYNVWTQRYGFGIDTVEELVRIAAISGVIERSGSWYRHSEFPNGQIQGQPALMDFLRIPTNAKLRDEIVQTTLATIGRERDLISQIAPMSNEPEDPEEEVVKMGQDWTGEDAPE
jgi:recombination protein RecA